MLDTVKHHSGNWEGVKGLLDQWPTVLAKATCAEPVKTSDDCSCLKRHKNWKSHPEKMVRNAVEVRRTAEAGSHTHTISHPGGKLDTDDLQKAQHESMQAAATNHIGGEKQKQKSRLAKPRLRLCVSHRVQSLSQTHHYRCHLLPVRWIANCLPTAYYAISLHAAILCSCKGMKRKYTRSTHWRRTLPKQKADVKQTALFLL